MNNKLSSEDQYQIQEWFTYHPPTQDQIPRYENIRSAAAKLAKVIYENCVNSADLTCAIRKLRECVMTANASIALERKPE